MGPLPSERKNTCTQLLECNGSFIINRPYLGDHTWDKSWPWDGKSIGIKACVHHELHIFLQGIQENLWFKQNEDGICWFFSFFIIIRSYIMKGTISFFRESFILKTYWSRHTHLIFMIPITCHISSCSMSFPWNFEKKIFMIM